MCDLLSLPCLVVDPDIKLALPVRCKTEFQAGDAPAAGAQRLPFDEHGSLRPDRLDGWLNYASAQRLEVLAAAWRHLHCLPKVFDGGGVEPGALP